MTTMSTETAPQLAARDFRAVVDAMPEMVWIAEPDGTFDFFNRRWLEYTGQTPDQLAERGLNAAIHPEDLAPTMETWRESVEQGEEFEREMQLRRAEDGTYRWFLCRAVPVKDDWSGQVRYWIGVNTDITDQKREQSEMSTMIDHAMDGASRQQAFFREILSTLTGGNLVLCDSGLDLPQTRETYVRGMDLTAESYALLRRDVREIAGTLGFSPSRCLDLSAAVSEAAMNALIHCGGGAVRIYTDGTSTLQIWIEDAGPGSYPESPAIVRLRGDVEVEQRECGHGFLLMVRLADRIWLLQEPDGTSIVLEMGRERPDFD